MTKRRPKRSSNQPPPAPNASAEGFPLPASIVRLLDQVSARVGFLRVLEGLVWVVVVACSMLLLRCLGDRWLDFPRPLRILLLVGDLFWLGWLFWIFPLRALRTRESREESALRVEKDSPGLRSRLISTVQLSKSGSSQTSPKLLQILLSETVERSADCVAKKVVSGSHLRRPTFIAAGLALLVAALCFGAWSSAQPLLQRYFGLNTVLPTMTKVLPVSKELRLPLGSSATLAARAEGYVPRSGKIVVSYETGEKREFSVMPDPADPALFQLELQNIQSSLTYQFHLNDGRGERYAVASQITPQIRELAITADFPDYTGWETRELKPAEISVLKGTVLTLAVASSQPLAKATWQPRGTGEPVEMLIDPGEPAKASLSVPLDSEDLTGFSVGLVNQDGVASRDDALHPISVTPDRPPEIKLIEPAEPPATITTVGGIDIVAEISDDMGISEVNLCIETADGTGEPRRTKLQYAPDQERLAFRWIPGRENPAPKTGDSLVYYLEAKDNNTATGPGVGESPRGSVTVVSAEEKLQEIDRKLHEKASEIDQLRESQRAASDDLNKMIQDP